MTSHEQQSLFNGVEIWQAVSIEIGVAFTYERISDRKVPRHRSSKSVEAFAPRPLTPQKKLLLEFLWIEIGFTARFDSELSEKIETRSTDVIFFFATSELSNNYVN